MLDGKCKKAFEKWYNEWCNLIGVDIGIEHFYDGLTISMQWGVYLEFFDGATEYKSLEVYRMGGSWVMTYGKEGFRSYFSQKSHDEEWTRQEAQTEAITKANEIFNERSSSLH